VAPAVFSALFLGLLTVVTGLRLWLGRRQSRHLHGQRDCVPPAFRDAVTPAEHARSVDYGRARLRVAGFQTLTHAVVIAGLTPGGGLEALQALWLGTGWPPLFTGTALLLSLAGVLGLVGLPFAAYATFSVEARFGFNRTSPALFLWDGLRQAAISGLFLGALAAGLLGLMGGTPFWWLWGWLLWLGFGLLLAWAYPRWIAPLFNRFQPLADPELRRRVGELLARCGLSLSGIRVMDASRRTAHGNAFFTGVGSAKRVVLYDTLLDTLAPPEVEAVLAHELGHYRLGHIRRGLVLSGVVGLAALALLGWLRGQPWFFQGLGVAEPADAAALGLFALAGPVFAFPLQPLLATRSRRWELQADAFAVRYSDGRSLERALVKLFRDNASVLDPDPLYARFHYSHPPPQARLKRLGEVVAQGARGSHPG